MIDEQKIREQYRDHEKDFEKIKGELSESLERVAGAFYQSTRFKVRVLPPRIKTVDSLISKMKNKGILSDSLFSKSDDKLSLAVNDFIGARISCNTREDVEEIQSLILQHPRITLVKSENLKKSSGYRALHLDVLYQVYWDDQIVLVPVEIQLKTQLQNAWSEITHDESYKPEDEEMKNEWEKKYSKHMADVLDTLDDMASTIRQQRLNLVRPPNTIDDSDTLVNQKTLSYKINALKSGQRLTQQEMTLAINRLKETGFQTLAEVSDILGDDVIEKEIKAFKEILRNNENVTPFELLHYGSLLKRNEHEKFKAEMTRDYGFVQWACLACGQLLTNDEYDYLMEQTDADTEYYCAEHRTDHFCYKCLNCGLGSSKSLCKNCEATTAGPF
jgi:ppGpp synthetase/RelA/SpoT-type nucleotidyltranferase